MSRDSSDQTEGEIGVNLPEIPFGGNGRRQVSVEYIGPIIIIFFVPVSVLSKYCSSRRIPEDSSSSQET